MKAKSVWIKNTMSVLTNGRNHSLVVDLPGVKGGDDLGPSALELIFMGLSGCVTTIYSIVAKKHGFEFEKLRCSVETIEEEGTTKILEVNGCIEVWSNDEKMALRIWKQTKNSCPVANILKAAGIKINIKFKHSPVIVEVPISIVNETKT